MVDLAHLTKQEGYDYVHMIKNNKRLDFLKQQHSGEKERELAKLSEVENFNKKNQYRLDKF